MKNLFLKLLVIVLLFNISIYPQEIVEAELLDEFEEITCEDVLIRTDILINNLRDKPSLTGYVIISINKEDVDKGLRYEQWIEGRMTEWMKADNSEVNSQSKVKIIRSHTNDKFRIQLWLTPSNIEKTFAKSVEWNLTYPKDKKPFIFANNIYEGSLCPPPERLALNLFAEILTVNSKATSNIVIKADSRKKFQKEKQELVNIIVKKYKISSKRLRFFYVYEKETKYYDFSRIEIWMLP